jgi:hypothetical protein
VLQGKQSIADLLEISVLSRFYPPNALQYFNFIPKRISVEQYSRAAVKLFSISQFHSESDPDSDKNLALMFKVLIRGARREEEGKEERKKGRG